jgi:drug/metabolite transporter (DMT)-like permease
MNTMVKYLVDFGTFQLVFFRSLSSFFSLFLLHYMSVEAAVTLRYTSPVFVALLAVFLLKEKIKPLLGSNGLYYFHKELLVLSPRFT